jgi:hypothetical protein
MAGRRRSFTQLTLIGGAVALALASCGGGGTGGSGSGTAAAGDVPHGSPVAVLTAASRHAATAGPVALTMSMKISFSGIPQVPTASGTMTATGASDPASQRSALDLDLSGLQSLTGGASRTPLPSAMKIFVDGTKVYVSTAGLGLSGTRPWIVIPAPTSGLNLSQLAQQAAATGPALISKLRSATTVGTEKIGGVETTHYHGVLDLGTAFNSLQAAGGAAALPPALLNTLKSTSVPIDAWVDGQERLRQVSMTFDLVPILRAVLSSVGSGSSPPALPASARADLAMTIGLSDYGSQVDLTPPPASEVGPAPTGFQLPGTTTA